MSGAPNGVESREGRGQVSPSQLCTMYACTMLHVHVHVHVPPLSLSTMMRY